MQYERNGVANLFMMFAPLEGWRCVKVTARHAAADYAQVLKELSDVHFPGAKQIQLMQDNLSTHTAASLYAAFPAAEARRLVKRFAWHYTPKHGSWLDMAESELAVLTNRCLSRRIPNRRILERKSPPGSDIETSIMPRPIDNSQSTMPASRQWPPQPHKALPPI